LLDNRGIVGPTVIGALARLQLARAEKLMGDETAARKSYEDFLSLSLWKDADPEIPIYQQAKAEYARLRKGINSHNRSDQFSRDKKTFFCKGVMAGHPVVIRGCCKPLGLESGSRSGDLNQLVELLPIRG
jgi:hypothetical protein